MVISDGYYALFMLVNIIMPTHERNGKKNKEIKIEGGRRRDDATVIYVLIYGLKAR